MINLFEIFDPSTRNNLPINWLFITLPKIFWLIQSRIIFIIKTLVNLFEIDLISRFGERRATHASLLDTLRICNFVVGKRQLGRKLRREIERRGEEESTGNPPFSTRETEEDRSVIYHRPSRTPFVQAIILYHRLPLRSIGDPFFPSMHANPNEI